MPNGNMGAGFGMPDMNSMGMNGMGNALDMGNQVALVGENSPLSVRTATGG